MADAGLLDTVNLYTMQKDDLTKRLSNILEAINVENEKSSSVINKANAERAEVRKEYETSSDEYKDAMDKIEDEYEASLAEIHVWEGELESEKTHLENRIQTVSGYEESFKTELGQNVQNDYKFGGQ